MQQVIKLLQTQQWQLKNKKLILPIILLALLLTPSTYELTKAVLADAFWQVSAYVAATLVAYHFVSTWMSKRSLIVESLHSSPTKEAIFASALGSLPGCGGAIIVVTQFVRGQMRFGSLVAVLTATMGDAAFLLLAAKPIDGFLMLGIGSLVGAITGVIVNRIHADNYMQPAPKKQTKTANKQSTDNVSFANQAQGQFWRWLFAPAFIIAILGSFQIDIDALLHLPAGSIEFLGMVLAVVAMILFAISHEISDYQSIVAETPKKETARTFQKVAQDTNFVTGWVIMAFLAFELTIFFTGWDLYSLLGNYYLLLPLMAALIGLLPGCGPQILVTSLYIQGAIPFSAQLSNGLSNDGDALFPAIALAPKAALVATLYSFIPALVCGYSYLFLFE